MPSDVQCLVGMRRALDHHNSDCSVPARAILLNPGDHAQLRFEELWGLPVRAHADVNEGRVRIDCEGSAWGIERELAEYLGDMP